MHESQLARQVLEVVLARARAEGAQQVVAVRGWLADSEGISVESLAFHFEAHARGTLAEGAKLGIAIKRISASCLACKETFETDDHVAECPRCGSLNCAWSSAPGLGIEA